LMRAMPSRCFLAKAPCPTIQIFIGVSSYEKSSAESPIW
jgi:hypothetical protein